MSGGVGRLGPDGVKVGDCCVLALGERNVLVASALDDGERNDFARHFEDGVSNEAFFVLSFPTSDDRSILLFASLVSGGDGLGKGSERYSLPESIKNL